MWVGPDGVFGHSQRDGVMAGTAEILETGFFNMKTIEAAIFLKTQFLFNAQL